MSGPRLLDQVRSDIRARLDISGMLDDRGRILEESGSIPCQQLRINVDHRKISEVVYLARQR